MRNPERFLEVLDACDPRIPDDSPYLLAKSGLIHVAESPLVPPVAVAPCFLDMVILWPPARRQMRYKYLKS